MTGLCVWALQAGQFESRKRSKGGCNVEYMPIHLTLESGAVSRGLLPILNARAHSTISYPTMAVGAPSLRAMPFWLYKGYNLHPLAELKPLISSLQRSPCQSFTHGFLPVAHALKIFLRTKASYDAFER